MFFREPKKRESYVKVFLHAINGRKVCKSDMSTDIVGTYQESFSVQTQPSPESGLMLKQQSLLCTYTYTLCRKSSNKKKCDPSLVNTNNTKSAQTGPALCCSSWPCALSSRAAMNSVSSQPCRPISTQSITSTDSADSEENYVAMVSPGRRRWNCTLPSLL